MNHMQHLETVALSDCAVLHSKEATYQGSWKRAGGISAWFMARRNLDRLITMMAPKQFPDHITTPQNVTDTLAALDHIVHHASDARNLPGTAEVTRQILAMLGDRFTANDIFAKIRANPGGEDGTVLAIVRDARRYFMLVEAEMIAEGVVEPESKTYEQETRIYVEPDTDVYQLIADEKGLSRQEVKDRIHALFYGNPPAEPQNGGYAAEHAERRRAEAVSDGGSQHASTLYPWQATKEQIDSLRQRNGILVDVFYTQRAGNVWQLEPVVGSQLCPREIYSAYRPAGATRWTLKRGEVPLEIWDNFPQLQLELNTKEHEDSREDFRFMYEFHESAQKWILRPQFVEWGREAG
jgi:hypothetical protein